MPWPPHSFVKARNSVNLSYSVEVERPQLERHSLLPLCNKKNPNWSRTWADGASLTSFLLLLGTWCLLALSTGEVKGASPHTRLGARDHCIFKHSHWWEKRSRPKLAFTLRLRDQRRKWMQDGYKSLHAFLHGIEIVHVSWSLGLFSITVSSR